MGNNYISEIRSKVGHIPMHNPVVTAIIYKDGKILLQKRMDNGCWAIHGGAIELGEKYLDTLKRELKEELNIEPINPELMGIYSGEELFNIYPLSKDQVYALNHVFFCEEFKGEINFTDGEVLDLQWFDLDNLPDNIFKINRPIINDVKKIVENHKVIVN